MHIGIDIGVTTIRRVTPGAPLVPEVAFLSSAAFIDTANDYRIHTFTGLNTSGHVAGADVFLTFTLRNATANASPSSITVNGVPAALVSNTESTGFNLFLTHSSIWRIPAAAVLGATSTVVVTLPVGAGMNGGGIALYAARNAASVEGFTFNPVLSSITNSTVLNFPVVGGDAVIAAGGQRNIATIDLTGVNKLADLSLIAAGNRRAASGFAASLSADAGYSVTLVHPSAAGASFSAVRLSGV